MRDVKQFKYKVVFHSTGKKPGVATGATRSFNVKNLLQAFRLLIKWSKDPEKYKFHITKLALTTKYYETHKTDFQK